MASITDLKIDGRLIDQGTIPSNRIESAAEITPSQLQQQTQQRIQIPFTFWRVWDALHTNLPGTAAADDLALIGGTFGTNSPTIQTGDLKSAGATTRYARAVIALPHNFDEGETVTLRAHAGMKTTVADNSATIDFEVYESDLEEGVSSDLITTSALDINSLTLADKDFTLTSSGLAPGDVLDIRMAISVNDAASGTAVIGMVGNVELLIDTLG